MECRKRDESKYKEFVDVLCLYRASDGKIIPFRYRRADGTTLSVEVTEQIKAASLRAGGQGMRYKCRILNRHTMCEVETYLFHDGSYWFIEIDGKKRQLSCAGDILPM